MTTSARGLATRERLIDAAMRLFAERGFRATTVGDIEAAAGLTPRAGALYRHFPSKQAVLEAGLERHVEQVASIEEVMALLPLGDLRAELTLLARWFLGELRRQREVTRVLEQEGEAFPEVRDRMFAGVVDRGYAQATELVRRRVKATGGDWDAEALAAVLVGALVNYRRTEWTFGSAPLALEEGRLVDTWVEVCLRVAGPEDRTHEDRL